MTRAHPKATAMFPVPVRRPLDEAREFGPEQFGASGPADWCPGCGHAEALEALKAACSGLGVANKDLLCVAGTGCAGSLPEALLSYGMRVPAGRALPVALGAKLVNPDLFVIAVGGEGETAGPGLGHLMHAARLNADLTFLMLDSGSRGFPADERTFEPAMLALAAGATFAARVLAQDSAASAAVMAQAVQHRGFSFVHVLGSCPPGAENLRLQLTGSAAPSPQGGDGTTRADAAPLGVLFDAANVPSYEEFDPVLSRRGAAVRENLGLSPKDIAELEACFK
ncbi:MAG: hypothetical protein HY748_00335 [Elusimicrobia bacterium]|nr:hypothetical protein [Elusimicrobiota bacterium]